MSPILKSFQPIWRNYKIEIVIATTGVLVFIGSCFIFAKSQAFNNDSRITITNENKYLDKKTYVIDIEGAVNNPDVYTVLANTRYKDAIKLAGGLSKDADRSYVAKKINLAENIHDQEKIYIPFIEELNTSSSDNGNITRLDNDVVSMNNSSNDQLDKLPGVGPTTAEKIIQGRPYKTLEELISKKILSKSVYEKIKQLITL